MKVLMAAPYEVKGRYQGGISSIVNTVLNREDYLSENDLQIVKYETCRVERSEKSDEQVSVSNLKNCMAIYTSLAKEVQQHNPDVLYFHSSVRLALLKDLLSIRRAKKKTGVKTVVHIHFAEYDKIMTGKEVIDNMILSILKKYIDKVVFLSQRTAEEFVAHGLDRKKTAVVYNFSTVEYTAEEQEKTLHPVEGKCKLLFVGSIDRRKGICDLLECLTKVQNSFELHICGGYREEDTKNEVKDYISRMGASTIIEHGYVSGEEKRQIYLSSDVLVLPSYGEGLPMVIMEAYHAGCAVISTSVGAIPEVVGDGNGFVIESGNKEQLLMALDSLINDSERLKKMKKANIETSVNFTLKKFTHDLASVCRELI